MVLLSPVDGCPARLRATPPRQSLPPRLPLCLQVLGSVVLGAYVAASGLLLLRYERSSDRVRAARAGCAPVRASDAAFRRECGFLYSHAGRCGYVALSANFAWTCDPPYLRVAAST